MNFKLNVFVILLTAAYSQIEGSCLTLWQCYNGQCIDVDRRCDNFPDCPDESDENNCRGGMCAEDQIRCETLNGSDCLSADLCDCGPTPDIDNGSITLNNLTFTKAGATANVSCDDGFETTKATITCKDYGLWESSTCKPIDSCLSQWQCNNGQCIDISSRCDNFPDCSDLSDEKNCTVEGCLEGQMQCETLNGPDCVSTDICDCGPTPDIDNGSITLNNLTFTKAGATANVSCDDGFETTKTTITCKDYGLWENSTCKPIAVDGGWSEWLDWTDCSKTCDSGFQTRNRTCSEPRPTNGGSECVGDNRENQICNEDACPVDGVWSPWSVWSDCSQNCGLGFQTRNRTCDNPAPNNGGADCVFESRENQSCKTTDCPETTTGFSVCLVGEWQCQDWTCIKETQTCDNYPDCPDGSDEQDQICKAIACASATDRKGLGTVEAGAIGAVVGIAATLVIGSTILYTIKRQPLKRKSNAKSRPVETQQADNPDNYTVLFSTSSSVNVGATIDEDDEIEHYQKLNKDIIDGGTDGYTSVSL